MIQFVDDDIMVAGVPLQPSAFAELVKRHPKGLEKALALEAEARQLMFAGFSDRQLSAFIQRVCEWGGYPETANRILKGNDFLEIRRRFTNAIDALTLEKPAVKVALREIRRVRYLGLSFASKHLRLLRPELCPILDSTLSEKLGYPLNLAGYKRFSDHCLRIAGLLQQEGIINPAGRDNGAWYAADVEMGLFVYVKEQFFH